MESGDDIGATFGWESITTILREPNIREMIHDYWEELSPIKQIAPLDPDFETMMRNEAAGSFKVWAARSGDGLLIGVILLHIMPHLNYKSTLFAFDAGHYLSPLYRDSKEWIGVKMWRAMFDPLQELGVKVLIAHDNALRPLTPFFLRLGFEPRSTWFWRAL